MKNLIKKILKEETEDKGGNYKTEADFEDGGEGWYDHPDKYRWDSEDYKNSDI